MPRPVGWSPGVGHSLDGADEAGLTHAAGGGQYGHTPVDLREQTFFVYVLLHAVTRERCPLRSGRQLTFLLRQHGREAWSLRSWIGRALGCFGVRLCAGDVGVRLLCTGYAIVPGERSAFLDRPFVPRL